ncbi:MAG: 4a-hydroxytetrahydrobiopterin dehydratase [Pseudomonadota bacterium]
MSDPSPLELVHIPQWAFDAQAQTLTRRFTFDDFDLAFEFMTRTATVARALNHHPDWCQHYNRVHVSLTTHEQQRVTELDYRLARDMDALYDAMTAPRT